MTRYKCPGCGARLESLSTMAGQEDQCPICGHVCIVPVGLRKTPLILLAALSLISGLVIVCVYWGSENQMSKTRPVSLPNAGHVEATTKPVGQPLTFEYLETPVRKRDTIGFNAHVLIKPMTRTQLEALGQELIKKMHELNADHLKACIYYNRADYEIRKDAIWMNAVGTTDYKLNMVGSVPKTTTPQGLFEAYVSFHTMVGSCRDKELDSYEYNHATATLICHEGRIGGFGHRVHVPSIVAGMTTWYLPPDLASSCWSAIPGLKRVVVHIYGKSSTKPMATVSFARDAYVQSLHLYKAMLDKDAALEEIEHAASKRRRAKVMSDDEYRAVVDVVARRIHKLYEDICVELSPRLDIKLHTKLPKAPPEFYRRYHFGVD